MASMAGPCIVVYEFEYDVHHETLLKDNGFPDVKNLKSTSGSPILESRVGATLTGTAGQFRGVRENAGSLSFGRRSDNLLPVAQRTYLVSLGYSGTCVG